MEQFTRKIPDPLLRVIVAFVIVIVAVVAIRAALPSALIDEEMHVASTIEREVAREPLYAGSAVCADCHEESAAKDAGYHQNLSCETCHGTARAHSENPMDVKPEAPRKREFCELCHHFDPSRPTGFPQINPVAHNPLKPCVSCHNPHDPKPPTVPQECQGCHGEIARSKSVSPHVLLECAECHTAPEAHRVTPRLVRPTTPSNRDFCGRCHASTAKVQSTPKVDFATHGEKYLCWQCHYPHMPEVR